MSHSHPSTPFPACFPFPDSFFRGMQAIQASVSIPFGGASQQQGFGPETHYGVRKAGAMGKESR